MTDPAARGDTLGLRLALAFLGVALAAVALLAGLTAAFSAADVSNLASRQRADLTSAIAIAAGATYARNDSWQAAGLSPVLDLAARTGADVAIQDRSGQTVITSPGFRASTGAQSSAPITADGARIGQVVVRSSGSGLGAADRTLETALLRAIAGAAGLAALLALITGLTVARRITRPVTRLIAVTRSMASGDRAARAGGIRAPGELRELAIAFDQMASTLDRQEQLRRDLVADVAHELRTPVAILQAGHEALLDGLAEPTPAWLRPMPPPCSWC
jgi:two-component system, OmpR family, sensor histidine kinase BaeS